MQNNTIQCKDKNLYSVDYDLMQSIRAQGDFTNNVLLNLVIKNPDVFCNHGLNYLRPFSDYEKPQAHYDSDLEILTYQGVEHDLCINEHELDFENIESCYEYTATLENGDYIYLSWDIDVFISPTEINNPPVDFNNPFVSEYTRNS